MMGESRRMMGEWWGRARHRRIRGESRRDTQLRGKAGETRE